MLKKIVIAGLAVAVGVAVLAWLSPKLISVIRYQGEQMIQDAEDSVPLETEIGRLRGEVKRLESEESKYFDQVAKQAVEVDKLQKDVEDTTGNLAKQQDNMSNMARDLKDTVPTSFHYNGRKYSREEVTDQLKRDMASYDSAEKELQAKKDLLSAAQKSLAASEDQLGALKQTRSDMEVQLAKMDADLKLVRLKASQSNLKVDDSEYSQVKSDIAKAKDRIAVMQKSLELEGQFTNGTIDATAGQDKADEKDVLKQFDAKFNHKDAVKIDGDDSSK